MENEMIIQNNIESKILSLRGKQVMIDRDLAELYGVETRVLNQAVKRNIERFPEDFMFALEESEKTELVTNCDRFNSLKKADDDNPTIGIIFCADKDESIVKYSVLNESEQIFASKYRTVLPTEEELQLELERNRRFLTEN